MAQIIFANAETQERFREFLSLPVDIYRNGGWESHT